MKTAGVGSILVGNRTQWGWHKAGAAAGWSLFGSWGAGLAACWVLDPARQGWGEAGSPVWLGLIHDLALLRTPVKAGVGTVSMGGMKTFGVPGTVLSDPYSSFWCMGLAGQPPLQPPHLWTRAWTVRDPQGEVSPPASGGFLL